MISARSNNRGGLVKFGKMLNEKEVSFFQLKFANKLNLGPPPSFLLGTGEKGKQNLLKKNLDLMSDLL